MTFAEHLKEISNILDFEVFITTHCTAIRDAMEDACNAGFRTFQIDVTQPIHGQQVDCTRAAAVNCYTLVCDTDMTYTKIVLVAKRIEDFLHQLGFKNVYCTNISGSCWLTRLLKVEW